MSKSERQSVADEGGSGLAGTFGSGARTRPTCDAQQQADVEIADQQWPPNC
jgi:hypothetical protein